MRILAFGFMVAVLVLSRSSNAFCQSSAPKKVLVVTTSTRNRFQNSIDEADKMLVRLSEQSHAFTLDYARQPTAPQPKKPKAPVVLPADASAELQAGFNKAEADYKTAFAAYEEADKKFTDELKRSLEKLSPDSLKNYDAVVFCYTSGDLPLPDFDGFLAWIKAGHAFIGLGSAMETMNKSPAYYDLLGGTWSHFKGIQGWVDAEIVNGNPDHPANKRMPARWALKEFSYKFPHFVLTDTAHTQVLLSLDKSPTDQAAGHFPLAWCRDYGQGRVFFTSLGGNQDLWDAELANRKNSPETARLFESHLLDGILWVLHVGS